MSLHNLFSPSGAFIWQSCIAGHIIKRDIGLDKEEHLNTYTQKGRRVHDIFERMASNAFFDTTYDVAGADKREVNLAMSALDYVTREVLPKYDNADIYLESYVPLELKTKTLGVQQTGGTADLIVVGKTEYEGWRHPVLKIGVYDLKTGVADIVSPYNNSQLIIYAKGTIEKLKREGVKVELTTSVTLGIFQPTLDYFKEWVVDVKTIEMCYLRITKKLVTGDSKPVLGPHCKYCPVKQVCPGMLEFLENIMAIAKNPAMLHNLPDSRKIEILKNRTAITRLFRELEVEFIGRIRLMGPVDGLSVKMKEKRETYKDEEKFSEFLVSEVGEDVAYARSLISVAQARSVVGNKYYNNKTVKTKKAAKELAVTKLKPFLHRPPR